MNNNYFYTFRYVHDDSEVEYTCNADVNMSELIQHLRYFLRACSWTEPVLDEYLGKEDD